MKIKDYTGIVPPQYTGKEIEAIASIELKDSAAAAHFYTLAKHRLLNVNNWHETAGTISADFKTADAGGSVVNRNVEKGDYLKIDIPGPGSKEGGGFDWVTVEELKEISEGDVQSVGFRVRPASNPVSNKDSVAHFYDAAATSTFIVTRQGTTVSAVIIDRNLKPNDDTVSLTDKMRHALVGLGAIASFSKLQWQNLANGIVKEDQ